MFNKVEESMNLIKREKKDILKITDQVLEMKIVAGAKSRLEIIEEKTSEFEDRAIKTVQNETYRKKMNKGFMGLALEQCIEAKYVSN